MGDKESYNSINNVEIFATGTWNGNKITSKDLDNIVAAFDKTSKTLSPVLKLGHDDKQPLLKTDGLPNAGIVSAIRRKGDKLVADFKDIPKKVFQAIQKKAFRKVSVEIFHNIDIKGEKFPRLLSAVALLGSTVPAVMNLNDILDRFNLNGSEDDYDLRSYTTDLINKEGLKMATEKTEKEINLERDLKEAQEQLAQLKADNEKYSADVDEQDKKVKELEAENKQFKADAKEAEKKAFAAECDAYATELQKEKLCTPAMKPYVLALLGEEKEKYSIKEEEKDKKELIKDMLKLFSEASAVNFEESSVEGEEHKLSKDALIEKEIEEYAAENKVEYRDAYSIVMAKHSKDQEPQD